MTGHVIVEAPGSIRHVNYYAKRDEDGRYPVTYWGTLEEQIADAQATILKEHSGLHHKPAELYTMLGDCSHENPEDAEKFEGVDDLVDEWMARNCAGLAADYSGSDWRMRGELYRKNRKRAELSIPLYREWVAAMDVWEDGHSGNVCMLSPAGSCCRQCTNDEYGEDWSDGVEDRSCSRQYMAKEVQDEFWSRYAGGNDADF